MSTSASISAEVISRTVTALIGQPARRSSGHPDGAGRGPRPAWPPRRESLGDDLDEHTSIDIEHGLVAIAEEVREEHGTTAHRRQRPHLLGQVSRPVDSGT